MLKDEFRYFLKNKDKLVEEYNGKFIVIKNKKVLGAYDSELEAVEKTSMTEEIGTFLVQKCEHGNESFTQNFYSQVYFSEG